MRTECVKEGWEGVMVRARDGAYKQGGVEPRSTVKELFVAKLKRVEHHEARVLSVYEQMQNANEASRDEIGRVKRSTAKGGKVGKGVLGGCRVIGVGGRWDGVRYDVGGGWTDAQRAELWAVRDTLAGRDNEGGDRHHPGHLQGPQFPRWVDWKWEGDL
jgi:DNA ligase-1